MKYVLTTWGIAALFISGCGPSDKERTLSILNTEADRWDGGSEFAPSATDAYGRPVTVSISKTVLDYVLEVRSNGPDGLAKNSDDIVVNRSKRHGKIIEVTAEAGEKLTESGTIGVIKGIKKGIVGSGSGKEKDKDKKKDN
ncbi:MAG: hypothetical protein EXS09_20440 [Gemmataceae bacterium]|nr:hypothetical protein [Gemmataceae bacterium]